MASNHHDREVLNRLVEATLDSAHGYDDAAKDTSNPHFKTLFGMRAIERKQLTAELQTEVRRLLGGDPAHTGTIGSKSRRFFMHLKAALTGSDEGIVNSIEAAEGHLQREYETALNDEELSRPVVEIIQKAYGLVKSSHDQMRDMKRHVPPGHDGD